MGQRTYRVKWEATVTAGGIKSAARKAREVMLEPARTDVQLVVERLSAKGAVRESTTVYYQDPDRSDE